VPDSFAHPAKLDAQLCIWITEHYTKPGDTIADFMAGSGTQMLACTMGRNVILGELESKYIRLCIHNWEIVKMHPQLGCSLGDCLILWGDSRNLESLRLHPYRQLWLQYPKLDIPSVKSVRRKFNLTLAEQIKLGDLVVDKIVSSPPYSDSPIGGGLNIKPPRPGHNDQTGRKPSSPSQLGAGKYADAIVTSPPYANPATEEIDDKYDLRRPKTANWGREAYRGRYGDAEEQIGKPDYGEIDTVISSSPYEGSVSVPNSRQDARAERLRKAGYDPKKYQGGPGRNLQQDWSYHPK